MTKKLNGAILKDSQYAKPNDVWHDQDIDIKGYVLIDKDDIQRVMDNLRGEIASICFTYEKGNEEFKDVFEEVEQNGGLAWFNEETENED